LAQYAAFAWLCAILPGRISRLLGWDTLLLGAGLAATAALLAKRWRASGGIPAGAAEFGLLALWFAELLALLTSAYPRNTSGSALSLAFLTLACTVVVCLPPEFRAGAKLSLWAAVFTIPFLLSLMADVAARAQAFRQHPLDDFSALKLADANEWGTITLALLPFCVRAAVEQRRRFWRAVGWLASLIAATGILLTLSRGALLGLVTFVCVAVYLSRRGGKWRTTAALSGAMLAGSILLASAVMGTPRPLVATVRMTGRTSQVRSIHGRLDTWRTSIGIAAGNWLTGAGPGNFAIEYAPISGARAAGVFTGRPHNLLIQLLTERGIAGAAIHFGVLLLFLAGIRGGLRRCSAGPARTALELRAAGLAALIVRESTYASLYSNPVAGLLFWLLLIEPAAELPEAGAAGSSNR
jgi:O-antigen ligase